MSTGNPIEREFSQDARNVNSSQSQLSSPGSSEWSGASKVTKVSKVTGMLWLTWIAVCHRRDEHAHGAG